MSTFKDSSTLRNPRIGQQFQNADFKHNYSPTSSCSRQYPFQYRPNSYHQHPNSNQSWKPWHGMKLRQQITASDVVSKGIGDGHAQKENSHTTQDKIKDFIQKGVNKKLQEVGYQFSSILLLLPHVLIKSRKLSTAKCY